MNQLNANYPLYPGIVLSETEYKTSEYRPKLNTNKNVLEINYCFKGRMECRMADGCLQYIGEGDLFLNTGNNRSEMIQLPLSYYQGITITIDLTTAPLKLPKLLPDYPVDLDQILTSIFEHDNCLLILSNKDLDYIFLRLLTVPTQAKLSLYRLKVLELIVYISTLDIEAERCKRTYTKPQVDVIKQIHNYIIANLDARLSINDLALQFCISQTTLKTNFKGVYGEAIMTYIRICRIEKAVKLLRNSQKSIAEIAHEVGYESPSKFGAAFKDIMKTSPNEYRKGMCE